MFNTFLFRYIGNNSFVPYKMNRYTNYKNLNKLLYCLKEMKNSVGTTINAKLG